MNPDINKPQLEPIFRPEKKQGVNKTGRIVGWIFFVVVLAVICLLLIRRFRAGFIQYKIVETEEPTLQVEPDSMAEKHIKKRAVRRAAQGYQHSDVRKALNIIIENHRASVILWERALKMLPAGGASMTKEVAQKALERLQPVFVLLDSVNLKIADATTKAELIQIASRQPVDEAYKLSRLYVEVKKLISIMQEYAGYIRKYFETCQAAQIAVVSRDPNEYDVKINVINYYDRKIVDCQDLLKRRLTEVEQAASELFRKSE
ncbi:MAG: hypothetical protein ACETVX_07110 [bacterium]